MALIGTAGHVDHGKSTLVEALTGINPMHLPEEHRRELTIELGFAHLQHPDGYTIGIVDVPGHEKLVRTMISGASGFQIALWVVDAREGLMPQSLEHLDVLNLLGVPRIISVVTKAGLATQEQIRETVQAVEGWQGGRFRSLIPSARPVFPNFCKRFSRHAVLWALTNPGCRHRPTCRSIVALC